MSEERKFDEAAFDKAVAKPNGWSKVADPVAEIRKMRDGDEAFGKDVLRTALSLVRAHFDGADDVFLEKSRELAARLDKEGRGDLASFVRAQTGDEPSWVPMERKPQVAPGNAAEMRAALNRVGHLAKDLRNITERDTEVRADVNEIVDVCRAAIASPARNCDVGTAEEQAYRFHAFCSDNTSEIEGMCNSTCPCIDCGDKCHCLCVWSQMPYAPAKQEKVSTK